MASRPAPPDGSNIGDIFRDYRAARGLNQGDLAELLGFSQSFVSLVESRHRHVRDIAELRRIARILDIPGEELGLLGTGDVETPTGPATADSDLSAEQQRWRTVRRSLSQNREALTAIAGRLYPDARRIGASAVLTTDAWVPQEPVPLEHVRLEWMPGPKPHVNGGETESISVRPASATGGRYSRYSRAIKDLAPPSLFENRTSYRLLDVAWGDGGLMRFGYTTYFDMVDVCETAAHELAAMLAGEAEVADAAPDWADLPFRSLAKDPFDLSLRPLLPSINTLTLRRARDGVSFVLHRREASKVAMAGGMYHIMPAGVFQPSSISPWDQANDFDLWRNMLREYSEEFLGNPEADGSGSEPIDYDTTEPYRSLNAAREAGLLQAWCFGVGVDPLSLAGEVITAVVIDADVYDEVFADMVAVNAEGTVVSGSPASHTEGVAFTAANVERLLTREHLAPAAVACLDLAWQNRITLLG